MDKIVYLVGNPANFEMKSNPYSSFIYKNKKKISLNDNSYIKIFDKGFVDYPGLKKVSVD